MDDSEPSWIDREQLIFKGFQPSIDKYCNLVKETKEERYETLKLEFDEDVKEGQMISSREVEAALRMLFPGELAKHAVK